MTATDEVYFSIILVFQVCGSVKSIHILLFCSKDNLCEHLRADS